MRIHLAAEHALELQLFDATRVTLDIGDDRVRGVLVVFHLDEFQQLAGAVEAFGQFADAVDGLVEQRTFAAQRLRACGIVPDIGAFEFAVDFFQALALGVVVKDTPSAHAADRTGRRCAGGRD
jgi:hypothetical protein